MATHAFADHTGELALRLEAGSLPALFAEAARALAEISGVTTRQTAEPWEEITIEAPDREALLVAWLDELLFRAERKKKLYPDVQVDEVSERRLRARIRGHDVVEPRTAVKAATFHGLRIRTGSGSVEATVILDV